MPFFGQHSKIQILQYDFCLVSILGDDYASLMTLEKCL